MEKYFDAKDMRNVIDDIEWIFSGYREHSDGLISCYEKYRDNDLFQGAVAEASKLFIGKHQITQAKAQVAMQQKLLDMYKHALTSFHEKVDKAPDARVDLETLDIVNKDFQDIYADLDEYVKYIEKVVKLLQARYGFLGIFTMPKCQPALDTFTALCGGDNPRSGFIYDLMQKFINFDADECAYADSLNFEQEIDDANNLIQTAMNMLEGFITSTFSNIVSSVTHTENSSGTVETTSGKRDEFAVVQERYGFTEEEMEYLKKNYPSLVISLYGASNYSTSDADKILQQIKEKLEKMNINTEEEKEVRELLENLGWNNLDDESIQELIQVLHKYNIDTKEEISAFLAQCAWETGWGKNLTELGSDEYFAGKAYGKKYRGAGYIQITWEYGYEAFATYLMLQKYPDLNGKYKNPANNSADEIKKMYLQVVQDAQDKGYDVSEFTKIVDEGADYVADHFAWESAGYFWSTGGCGEALENGGTIDDVSKIVNRWDTGSFQGRRDNYYKILEEIGKTSIGQ